jgi:hypothetical protein
MTRTRPIRAKSLLLLPLFAALLVIALASSPAQAQSGAAYTTTNQSPPPGGDGPGTCLNGNPGVNCNIYGNKAWVWTNGGPESNKLLPGGQYFFAVLAPGGQQNPNDGTPENLSDDYDTYQNRTFTVTDGEISAYAGTHDFDVDETDDNEKKIRLFPYANTPNPGGVYILAICYLGPTGTSYPVDPRDCKYDAFKVPDDDRTPPQCGNPQFSLNEAGQYTATEYFQDPGGLDYIKVRELTNVSYTIENFHLGTTGLVKLTATKITPGQRSRIVVEMRDVAGNMSVCDPVMASVKLNRSGSMRQVVRGLSAKEHIVRIHNGRPGLSRFKIRVNGKTYSLKLRPGQKRAISIRAALRKRGRNVVVLVGSGRPGGTANVLISN